MAKQLYFVQRQIAPALALAMGLFVATEAPGQQEGPVMQITDIEGVGRRALIETPRYRTSAPAGRAVTREWSKIRVTYESYPEWIDELTFEYYALLAREVRGAPTTYELFRGGVTYMDIAQGRNKQSTAFLQPNTLARYGEVIAVAVEVSHEGETVAVVSLEAPQSVAEGVDEWWRNPNLTPRDGRILDRSQTPFAFVNYDQYETIKP